MTRRAVLLIADRLQVAALGIRSLEEEAFDFIGGVQRVAFGLEKLLGPLLEHATDVGRVRRSALIDDVAKDQYLARAEDIGGRPVERTPVDAQTQVAAR